MTLNYHPTNQLRAQFTYNAQVYWRLDDKDRADGLLQRTYAVAQITRARGGLWYPFGRRWATLRKKLPLSDVAQAGGWDDIKTLTCYQLANQETLRQVADYDV